MPFVVAWHANASYDFDSPQQQAGWQYSGFNTKLGVVFLIFVVLHLCGFEAGIKIDPPTDAGGHGAVFNLLDALQDRLDIWLADAGGEVLDAWWGRIARVGLRLHDRHPKYPHSTLGGTL